MLGMRVLLLSIILTAKSVLSQNFSHYGVEFNIGFMPSTNSTTLRLLVHSQEDNAHVTVSRIGYNYSTSVTRNALSIINLPFHPVVDSSFNSRDLGFHITSSSPVSIVGASGEIKNSFVPHFTFLSLPYHDYTSSTTEYSYLGVSTSNSNPNNNYTSQILLVGNRDNTTFTIRPSCNLTLPVNIQSNDTRTLVVVPGDNHTSILHSHQTLLMTSINCDLIDTMVTSNHPLSIFGGGEDCSEEYECGSVATQISPTIAWGDGFLLAPSQTINADQLYTVIASEENTIITRSCDKNTTTSLLSSVGEVYSFNESTALCYLTCSQRCYVAHYGITEGAQFLIPVSPLTQYPNTMVSLSSFNASASLYTVTVPARESFNGTLVINGSLVTPNWSSIYDKDGVIVGYGYTSSFSGMTTIAPSSSMNSLYVAVYNLDDDGAYSYAAGTLLNPLFPSLRFLSDEYCLLNVSDQLTLTIQRINDFSISFNTRLAINLNYTLVKFLAGEREKTINVTISNAQFGGNEPLLVLAEAAVSDDPSPALAETAITIQNTKGVDIGFAEERVTVMESDNSVALNILSTGAEIKCLPGSNNIVLLLQLNDFQGRALNVTRLTFNQYVRKQSVDVKLDSFTNDSNQRNMTGKLIILFNSGLDVSLKHSQVIIVYDSMPMPSNALMSTLSSMLSSSSVIITPTQTVSDFMNTLLNPTTAYVIGISGVLLTLVLCSYILVASFCCGRHCKKKKKHNLNESSSRLQESSGHYVVRRPYNLTAFHPNYDNINHFGNRVRADSQRRPPPLPPNVARPLPLLSNEIHTNKHNDEDEVEEVLI
ncbi:PREDICTED: uncharacterized protein LOC109587749 [Amphimedon queenslandica]|uniref:IgGFc-binding protein N-terminal domain-containing protein n=1 Tax=Amphimedon queenslandica TaxID=400682 RepID=A0A1X7VQ77_AMPQE|nr:PREDICTED: uncharacterized protein LOC109587749 [Amphimedon queenslandica]|eukprot:XP_019859534.1 PREDICTED: uncharacterized protein LOC109587749 [Amphimedon queenslandica]